MTNIKTIRRRFKKSQAYSILRRIQYQRVALVTGLVTMMGLGAGLAVSITNETSATNIGAMAIDEMSTAETIIEVPVKNCVNKPDITQSGSVRCMVYTGGESTCTGVTPYVGCVAGSKELLGKSCYLYETNSDGTKGNFIGKFKFDDTGYGVNGSIESGDAICVYRYNMDSCNDWVATYGDNVYIEVINS